MGVKVLVADRISERGLEVLRREPGVEVDVKTGLAPEDLIGCIGEYDGLIVRSGTRVTEPVIAAARRLRVIGRAGVGVDNIDVEAATRKGIVVINAPEGNTVATAEHTIAMMFALARWIPQAHASMIRDRRWDRQRFTGMQLQGKVLGVIGLGRVGSQVARRAVALGMQVLAYDPYIAPERARELGVEMAEVDDICRRAHVITVHTPLTRATENLIGRRQFELMQPGVRIINCARGGVIDEDALYEALKEGKVAGAALDVFREEPPWNSPLLELDRVVVTPHLGASTTEAQVHVAVDVAAEVLRALKGEPVRNAVNLPALAPEVMERLLPYLDLAERLGRLYTELVGGGHRTIELVYSGQLAELDCGPLTRAVLKGMLDPVLQEAVNYVNAPLVARERGIRVSETRQSSDGDFQSLITVRGSGGPGGERTVAGTLTGRDVPTLVGIDGYRVNVDTPGYLLVARNVDRPGMIGRVGTLLGENRINIAFMQVGRKAVGEVAVMVLGVDDPIPPAVMERLEQVEDLWDTRLVKW
ncbi:MAG: phosphoglycerate dehydrogenase [Firmicutes bacterium]|nr:phosphoglycerate dehydrogenase [Bacillota bacterium]